MAKRKKPDHWKTPPTKCVVCEGRGEVQDQYITRFFGSSNWTYKKCESCKGTGDNEERCVGCGEVINVYTSVSYSRYCSNKNCGRYGLLSVLIKKL